MKQTEHAADRLIEWLRDFRALATVRDKIHGAIYIGMFGDGTGTITINQKTFGSSFRPISEALDAALEWVLRDETAEQNATLGLSSEGRFDWDASEWDYPKNFNLQEISR